MDGMLNLLLLLIPAVLAITVHEVAHGWAALQLGDNTAAAAGRLSLNPMRHIDPIGTLLVPATLYFVGEYLLDTKIYFGWARPVPVRWDQLSPRSAGIALVAAAGPGANFLMLGGWLMLALTLRHTPFANSPLIYMCQAGIIFNAAIMVINLIPIPPLDGSRIVSSFLPPAWAVRYNRIEMFGLMLVVLLIVSGVLAAVLRPVFDIIGSAMSAIGV